MYFQDVCTKGCFTLPAVSIVLTKVRTLLTHIFKYNNALTTLRIQEHILQVSDKIIFRNKIIDAVVIYQLFLYKSMI